MAKLQTLSETPSEEKLELSQNKAQNESATWFLMKLTLHCFALIVVPSVVQRRLTTDGAVSHSEGTGDRLLAAQHKIKIQILLEKLTRDCGLLFSVYHVSLSLSNGQKNPSALKKSLLPSETSQPLWQMTDVSVLCRKLLLIRVMDHKSWR